MMPDLSSTPDSTSEGEEDFSPSEPTSDIRFCEQDIPTRIGPYQIDSLLGSGGMSVLFVGRKENSSEPLIVKVLSKRFLTSPDAVKRFLAEADIIALANHPNIVTLLESGNWEGGLYIAMEYIRGKTLRETILKTPLSLKNAVEVVLEIAYAVCHLHSHHVIHRDLKPENILITYDNKVKVIDFGIAQLLYTEEIAGKGPKRFIGTPIYMSPEQREAPEKVSYPSDIYSLGIIAYELVMGRISKGQIHLALLPKGLQKILSKALQPDPHARYHDTVDFVSDLSDYLHSAQLKKDIRPLDKIIEDVNALKLLSVDWFQPTFPQWDHCEIKAVWDTDAHFPHLAWDFIENETHQAFIFFECLSPSIVNTIPLAWLKGSLEARKNLLEEPNNLAIFLNQRLLKSPGGFPYFFACLSFTKNNSATHFTSAGGLEMTLVGKKNKTAFSKKQLPLGIEESYTFSSYTFNFEKNDKIFIHPFASENAYLSFEQSLEQIFLEIKQKNPLLYDERPPYLFSFQR